MSFSVAFVVAIVVMRCDLYNCVLLFKKYLLIGDTFLDVFLFSFVCFVFLLGFSK